MYSSTIGECASSPMTPRPGWRMELFEVVPHLLIGTRLASGSEYATLGVDVIVDLEDWEWAWVPPVPVGKMYVSFPIEDEDEVDPRPATSLSSSLL
jgi:hypothetical protein